jgi:hypothetical protein
LWVQIRREFFVFILIHSIAALLLLSSLGPRKSMHTISY